MSSWINPSGPGQGGRTREVSKERQSPREAVREGSTKVDGGSGPGWRCGQGGLCSWSWWDWEKQGVQVKP